jgi:hypothetical protein
MQSALISFFMPVYPGAPKIEDQPARISTHRTGSIWTLPKQRITFGTL